MTTTDTTQEKSHRTSLHLLYLLFAVVLVIALLALAIPNVGRYILSDVLRVRSTSLSQAFVETRAEVYIMVRGWDGYNQVFALNPYSGEIKRRFDVGYNTAVKLTADRHILYVYQQSETGAAAWPDLFVTGIASAIDTRTGAVLWQLDVPGSLFGSPTKGAWLSKDEQHLYLQGNPGIGLDPHIFVVDTRTGTLLHEFELSLPYPSNMDQAFPLVWNLPRDEKLIVTSRDQLFTFDLATGQTGDATKLFDPESIYHVPLNLPQTAFVWDGAMNLETDQLFLVTSTQEILVVDLNTQPFTVKHAVSLPTGWQFAVANPLLLNSKERKLYVQVKRADTPIVNGLEVDEVWVYDTTTWMQQSRLDLREQLVKAPGNLTDNGGLDMTNYGLALSPDKHTVYSISRRGLLEINQNASNRLQGTWLNIGEENPQAIEWKFVVP